MSGSIRLFGFALLGSVLLAACSSGPLREFNKGDEIAFYDFSAAGSFEEGAYLNGAARLRVIDGVYRVQLTEGDGELWWGQWGETLDDVVVDVDVELGSDQPGHVFGVMCRVRGTVGQEREVDPELQALAEGDEAAGAGADDEAAGADDEGLESINGDEADDAAAEAAARETRREAEANAANGDGYLFLVQADGTYSIQLSRGRNLTPLVEWKDTDVINTGAASNRLRAVCVDDYLAFFINGQFVGDVIDDTYTRGQAGLATATVNRVGVRVDFDNLMVSEVR